MPMKRITLLLGLLIMSGCASASGEMVWTTETPADASELTGTWRGKYVCGQGVTALVLEVRGQEAGRVEGTFAFSAAPENPGVPSGSYRVEGSLSPGMVLRLDAREWIQQPQDYVSVSLVGRMDLRQARYYGFVDAASCETFTVSRE
jgi:hypothetical protein